MAADQCGCILKLQGCKVAELQGLRGDLVLDVATLIEVVGLQVARLQGFRVLTEVPSETLQLCNLATLQLPKGA